MSMMSGSDDHSAGAPLPPSCSSKWTVGDAVKYLSVRYVGAPYGVGMLGESVHDAYLNLLHAHTCEQPIPSRPGTTMTRPSLGRSGSGAAGAGTATGAGGPSAVALLTTTDRPTNVSMSNAGIPIPLTYLNEVEEFIELFHVMRDLDEQWLKRGSSGILQSGSATWKEFIRRNRSSSRDSDDHDEEEVVPPKLQLICDVVRVMKCCFQQLEQERENLRGKLEREIVTVKHYTERVTRLDRLMKFMNGIEKLIKRSSGLAVCKIDKGIYTDLFRDFAWIFGIEFSSVTTSKPLMVRGQAVSCIPYLLYDKYSEWTIRLPENILVITVVEVKSKASINTVANHDHQLRKHKHSDPEIDMYVGQQEDNDDDAYLPDSIRGQHACQLVRALTHTHVPNKNCMLGFIVQATKVRLTCLNMEKEHRESIKRADFNPADYNATIYLTKSYDMLDAFDRYHLIHMMVKLASFGGDLE